MLLENGVLFKMITLTLSSCQLVLCARLPKPSAGNISECHPLIDVGQGKPVNPTESSGLKKFWSEYWKNFREENAKFRFK